MRFAAVCLAIFVSVTVLFAAVPTPVPVVVPRSEQTDIRSKTGRDYRLFVLAPAKESPAPPGGYPVYYFTDANASFPLVASLARIQQATIGPVVLVGIGYPTDDQNEMMRRRAYDLTPNEAAGAMKRFQAARKADPNSQRRDVPKIDDWKFGGQEEFFDFIQNEVKPLIEKRFAIDTNRQALFGHSFGGLFTVHTLFTHPESFQTYIAASPALFLNPEQLAKEETAFTEKVKTNGTKARLLVTLGSLETGVQMGLKEGGVDPRSALAQRLKSTGMDSVFQQFDGEHHGSVIPFAHLRAMRFAFESATRPAR